MAKVVLTRRAVKDLDRLERSIRQRILEKIRSCSSNPLQNSIRLTDPRIGTFRHRIGDYRVIFDMDSEAMVILRIGHRKDVYR